MTSGQLGLAALWGAVLCGGLSVVMPGRGSRRFLAVAAVLAATATVILAWALVGVDLSIEYVAETTSRATPWPYRLAALWGGMDGSMLFYAAMTAAVAAFAFRLRHIGLALRVAAAAATGLMLFTAWFANPFTEAPIPAVDGVGLLAILQHPAMIYHPPLLYLGLTTLVIPFALAVERSVTPSSPIDASQVRHWLLVPWILLILGMLAGSSWAYVELGWGGFWAWDPVENTALMPWLGLTAAIHASQVARREGRLARSAAFLAMLPFVLSLLGVYLTRSGVTGSIHSFAEDPVIGRVLLTAALLTAVAVTGLVSRMPRGSAWHELDNTRATWLAGASVLVGLILLLVVIGSAYPAYAQVFFGEELAIDSTFFVTTVYPLVLVLLVGVALGLRTSWRSGIEPRDWLLAGTVASVGTLLVLVPGGGKWEPAPGVGAALMAVVLVGSGLAAVRGRRALGAHLAHLGVALVVLGAAASGLGADFSGTMRVGDTVEVGGRTVTLETVETGERERFVFARTSFSIDGEDLLRPEIRGYEEQETPVSEPALLATVAGDVIVAPRLLFPGAAAVEVSVFVRPLVWLVWVGAMVSAAGGLLALGGKGGFGGARYRGATAVPQPAGTTSGKSAR